MSKQQSKSSAKTATATATATLKPFMVRLPSDLIRAIRARAKETGESASEVARAALRQWFAAGNIAKKGKGGKRG